MSTKTKWFIGGFVTAVVLCFLAGWYYLQGVKAAQGGQTPGPGQPKGKSTTTK